MATYISPDNLIQQLQDYNNNDKKAASSSSLIQLIRPARLTLRDQPRYQEEYGTSNFWTTLSKTWEIESKKLELLQQRSTNDEGEKEEVISTIQALSSFLIGLTSRHGKNQIEAIDQIEPHLKKILLISSSLFNLEDPIYQPMIRTCCQALANLVTGNEVLIEKYFEQRLESEEKDQLLQRLLSSPDHGTLQAILIFLLNCIHSNRERSLLLGTSRSGIEIIDRIMVSISTIYDHDSKARPAPEFKVDEGGGDLFGLSFAIVRQMIELETFEQTYLAHNLMPGYSISPTLIILLKFLDGYLSTNLHAPSTSSASSSMKSTTSLFRRSLKVSINLLPFLNQLLKKLSNSLLEPTTTIEDEKDPSSSSTSKKGTGGGSETVKRIGGLDGSDAQTFQGVVLVLHCYCEVGLGFERWYNLENDRSVQEEENEGEEEEEGNLVNGRERLIDGIETVVRLLHFSQTLTPAPTPRPPPSSSAPNHPTTSSSSSPNVEPKIKEIDEEGEGKEEQKPLEGEEEDSQAIQQLKRICVQFLGICSFSTTTNSSLSSSTTTTTSTTETTSTTKTTLKSKSNSVTKNAQDRIRESGGLGLLLGMCQIDGRNPTLREHALFAIRNVLKGNLENQDYIERMKPEYKVGQDGSLEDLPPALRP